jgi:ribosomal protein S18 acetylase RimI-like enzyme
MFNDGGLSIVLASEHDIDRVMMLVAACIAHMRAAGIDQWDDVYPDRQTMFQDARDGTLYLASVDEEPLVGMLVVNDVQSPEYLDVPWTMAGARIAVVHRLMIDPRYQRRGLARELMRVAEQRARALGCDCVRLDAYSKNPRALDLYHRLGYHDAGSVTFRKGVFRCFEKKLVAAQFQPLKEHR